MKLIHLSDLHIGKRLNEFSLLEDQEYILDRIIGIIDATQPEAVMIAGDIYDKAVPPAEAVSLFDSFLFRLAKRGLQVFIISGNHDSPERLTFGSRLMEQSGIHIAPVYAGGIEPLTLCDSYGEINFYMLPFIKPSNVRRFYPDAPIESYTDAVRLVIDQAKIDTDKRNILITHQFVTGAALCDSEERSVGGSDNVDADIFDDFDYVALGHIHGPQNVGSEKIRYCGTPLKYSFSEKNHEKSVTLVELNQKGCLNTEKLPLIPLRDMREIKGSYFELTAKESYEGTNTHDYIRAVLTDEDDVPEALARLRVIYPNIMALEYDNTRTRTSFNHTSEGNKKAQDPLALFAEFYTERCGIALTEEQNAVLKELITEIWEENK